MKVRSILDKQAIWLLPVLVYLLALGSAEMIALAGNCHGWWEVCWSRHDSGLYLEISKIGHTLFQCGPENNFEPGSGKWCGNAGWAPFYPLLIHLVHLVTGIRHEIAGILLSHVFFLLYLRLALILTGNKGFTLSGFLTLCLCAFCPGGIYFFSIFPMSLMAFSITLLFYGLLHKQRVTTFLAVLVASVSYSSAILLIFTLCLYLLFLFFRNPAEFSGPGLAQRIKTHFKQGSEFLSVAATTVLPGVIGLLGLYLYDYLATGQWNAMYLVQNKYGHLLYSPVKHLGIHRDMFMEHWGTNLAWIDFHNIFFFFAVPWLIWRVYRGNSPLKGLVMIYLVIMWYMPYSISAHVSLYRSITLLSPALVFIHQENTLKKSIVLVIFGVFYYYLGLLFILSLMK